MTTASTTATPVSREAARALFEAPPVLVEVRFPACGTSPDWHLCDDDSEFEAILERVAAGAELHLSSVWDLTNRRGALVVRK